MARVEFGVMIRQEKTDFAHVREAAALCDELGYDSIWLYDHLLGMGAPDQDIFEAWTLLAALAPVTSRAKLGVMVTAAPFRHPSLLAKMAATLDNISGGRLEFALGAGWYEPEFTAYGYLFPGARERIERLREAVLIARAMWTQHCPSYAGKYYRIEGAYCNPKPLQKPHPPIIVGGAGEKFLLPTVAEVADGWNCPATSAGEIEHKLQVLETHCRRFNRSVQDLILSEQTVCVIAETQGELEEKLQKAKKRYGFFGDIESTGIVGTPPGCIERIKEKVSRGISKFTIFFSDTTKPETLALFAKEVMAAFR